MNAKLRALWVDIKQAFVFPFSRGGLRSLLTVCVMLLLPFGWIAGQGLAYAASAERTQRRGIPAYIKLGLRMFAAGAILAAPVLFMVVVLMLVKLNFAATPLLLDFALALLFGFALARMLLFMPLSACALAFGMPLREAVDGKTLGLILSGCAGRLLLVGALMLPLFFVAGVIDVLPGPVAYILGAAYGGLVQMIAAGLVTACFRRAFGMPLPPSCPPHRGGGFARRAVAGMLAAALVLGGPSVASASAGGIRGEDIQPVQPRDGAAGSEDTTGSPQSYNEAFRYYSEMGVLEPHSGNTLVYDPTVGYYVRPNGISQASNDAFFLTADVITDFIPVVSQIKDAAQMLYYGSQYLAADNQEDSDAALTSMLLKTASLATFGASKYAKLAKLGNGSAKYIFLVNKYGDQFAKGVDVLGNTIQVAGLSDHLIEGLRINGVIDEDTARHLSSSSLINTLRTTVEVIRNQPKAPAPAPFNIRPAPFGPGYRLPSQAPDQTPKRRGIPGNYAGKLTGFDYDAYGMSGSLTSKDVYITVTEAGSDTFAATITTSLVATFQYEMYGASLSGRSYTPVEVDGIILHPGEGDQYTARYPVKLMSTTTTNYAGEGYADGGGSMDTQSEFDYTIAFTLDYVDDQPVISGSLTADVQQAGSNYAVPQQAISFVCKPSDQKPPQEKIGQGWS